MKNKISTSLLALLVCGTFNAAAQGSFSLAGSTPFPTLTFASRMVYADFDNDGDVDVLYQNGNTSGTGIACMVNNGSGSYTTFNANGSGTFVSGPFNGITFTQVTSSGTPVQFVTDYDKDGDMDIVEQTNAVPGRVLVNGGGFFSVAGSTPFPTLTFASRMLFADFDNDGDTDVLYQNGNTSGTGIACMVNNGSGSYTTFNANGSGTFSSGPFNGITFTQVTSSGTPIQFAADYDNDGDIDIVEQTNAVPGRVLVNGGGSFSVAGSTPFPTLTFASRMVFADYDSDGDADVLYQNGNTSGTGISYMINNGNGTYTTINANGSGTFASGPFNGITFTQVTSTGTPIQFATDYDNDGDIDMIEQTNATGGRMMVQSGLPPNVITKSPVNGATNVYLNANIVLTFNETVTAGTGNIYIRRLSDNSIVETIAAGGARVSGSGTSTITIDPSSNLSSNTAYYINFSENAFRDAAGGVFGKLSLVTRVVEPITQSSFLTFTTGTLVLPVTLTAFNAVAVNRQVLLNWQTSAEINNARYVISRSADGVQFNYLGGISGGLNSSVLSNYHFTDPGPLPGISYYRLTQVDADGRSQILGTRTVRMGGQDAVALYPNPVADKCTIQAGAQLLYTKAVIADINGKQLGVFTISSSLHTLDMSAFPSGIYLVKFANGDIQKILKQ